MPFTLAHPAIVLPFGFRKSPYIDFTALFLGTMAPDFEYYYRFKIIRTVGHTIAGQFYYNLPVILLLALVFHYILKKPLIQHLPEPFNHWYYSFALEKWSLNTWKRWVVVIYSAIAGCFTHILWDAFTHGSGYFAQMIPILRYSVPVGSRKISLFSILQSTSSVVGLFVVAMFIYYIGYKNRQVKRSSQKILTIQKFIYWGGVMLISCLTLLIMHMIKGRMLLRNYIVISINGIFIGLCIMSLCMRIREKM